MEPSRALTIHQQQLTPTAWEMIRSVAPAMHASRLFGVNSPDQAAAIMLKGYELGLSLTASFEFVQIVEGKPALSPRGCLGLIHQHSELVEVKIEESTATSCTVWMRRKDTGFEFRGTWTIDDAKKAGLVKPQSGWDRYPSNMLRWRTVGFVADVVCPDLIGGMRRADEMGADLTPDGDVVQGQWREVPPPPVLVTMDDLLAEGFTPAQIMRTNRGTIPTTQQELIETANVLRARTKLGLEKPGDADPDDPAGVQELTNAPA